MEGDPSQAPHHHPPGPYPHKTHPEATWAQQEGAVNVALGSLQGKAVRFPLAEDLDRILRQYKWFATTTKVESSRQVTIMDFSRRDKGKGRALDSIVAN